jgi:hypothetical protein
MSTFKRTKVKSFWIFCLALTFPFFLVGQDTFDDPVVADSTSDYANLTQRESQNLNAARTDSLNIKVRGFSEETLNQLKADESLHYKEASTVAESLWDRLIMLLQQFFDSLFRSATTTDWGRLFSYAIGIVILIVVIMLILRVNAFQIFYSGQGARTMRYEVLDENIHEMDFDKLIQEAIAINDYRKAIRLLFLNALKILSDKQLVHWEHGKTNHDYLRELTVEEVKTGFNELNFYFEHAWYGNFAITQGTFTKVQNIFINWRERLR